jgi:hypothetical protein
MKYNSTEISLSLLEKQLSLYDRIDNLIQTKFEELGPETISDLTSTLIDLEDKIQLNLKELKQREMFNNN